MLDQFRMHIEDVFHLADGRTAIAGQIEGGESVMVQPGPAVVVKNGCEIATVEIESESLFSRSDAMSRRELRAVTTLSDTTLTSEMVKSNRFTLEGKMRVHQPRELIGIDSPPDDFLPDTLTLGPRLPAGWEGDAWTNPDETAYFLRAWNKQLVSYAIGRGGRYEDARAALMDEIQHGGRRVELIATETTNS